MRALPPPGQKRRGKPALQVHPLREQTWHHGAGPYQARLHSCHVFGGSGWVSSRFPAVCTPQTHDPRVKDLRGRPTQPQPPHTHYVPSVACRKYVCGGSGWVSSRFPAVCTPQILEDLRGRPTQPQPPHTYFNPGLTLRIFSIYTYIYIVFFRHRTSGTLGVWF